MKQHEFDNWVKDGISKFEQSQKVQWNKNQIFDEILVAQNVKKNAMFQNKYWFAALILLLFTLNIFQFVKINSINENYLNIKQDLVNTIHQNIELEKVLDKNQNIINDYKNEIEQLANNIELKDEQLKNLEQTLDRNISAREVQFITKYIHDTVFVKQQPEMNYLAIDDEDIKQPEIKDIEKMNNASYQYVSMYKPLISNNTNQKKETKIKILLGSDDSNVGQQNSKLFNLLSTDL